MSDYIILKHISTEELEKEVKSYFNKGYILWKAPFKDKNGVYHQTMLKK